MVLHLYYQSAFQWVRIVPLFTPTSFCIHTNRISVFSLNGKETVSISVHSHLQVNRWCIVHKQPRIWTLSWPDVSCWTWDQGHHREHQFCFLSRFTTVDWEGWSTFTLPSTTNELISISTSQTFRSWVLIFHLRRPMVFYLSTNTLSPGLLLVWRFYSEGQATFQ